jgi:hypothetical protein
MENRVDFGVGQNGRLLDANPQVGGAGRLNYARPTSPLISGDWYASGLAGRGFSLHSYSPISDPTAFRGPLGSASLSAFRRDSVSVMSSPLDSGWLGQPYYDPSTTVPSVRFLQGWSAPSAREPGTPGGMGGPIKQRVDLQAQLHPSVTGLSPWTAAALPSSPFAPAERPWAAGTTSGLFGVEPPRLLLPTEPEVPWSRRWSEQRTPEDGTRRPAGREGESAPGQLRSPQEALSTPLSSALRPELYPRIGLVLPSGELLAWTGKPGLVLPEIEPGSEAIGPAGPRISDASVLPGFDLFTDLQLAVALLADPNAAWFDEMRKALRERPELAEKVDAQIARDAAQFLEQARNAPLRTLTGRGASALNDQLLKAESLMEIGHYSEAVDRYESARLIEPTNPLPLIGKGHALLAQGNYRSAALALLQGIELADRYPGVASLLFQRLDLTALMGGGEIVDIRRADLMRELEQRETPELRFLLGYLEYHTGDRQRGMENLKRAADNPRSGPTIGRYPTILEGGSGQLPPAPGPVEPHQVGGGLNLPLDQPETKPAEEWVVPPQTE